MEYEDEKTLEEIIEDFIDELTEKLSSWWETGKDNIPKASDLIGKITKFTK